MKRLLLALVVLAYMANAWSATCTQYLLGAVNGAGTAGTFGQSWAATRQAAADSACSARGVTSCWFAVYDGGVGCHDATVTADAAGSLNQFCGRNGSGAKVNLGWTGADFSSRTGDYCPDSCPTSTTTKNITQGWNRLDYGDSTRIDLTPSGSPAPAGYSGSTGTVCVASCVYEQTAVKECWQSTEPTSSGLYRVSCDMEVTGTGQPCQATAEDADKADGNDPPPACDGFEGYVNGKKVCVPKVSSPPGSLAGSPPVINGNPAAGTDGSVGTLPTTGNGGNAGGPAGSRDGTIIMPGGTVVSGTSTVPSGTKTAVAGEEQIACGAPGQPKCRIDETGTPTSKELKLDEAAISAEATANRGTIAGTGDKGMFSSWSGLFVTPPVVACEAPTFTMAGGQTVTADPCPVVDGVRSVVGWLWALSGFWLCLGWIREAV